MKKIILDIDGMTCSACSNGLEKYLNKQYGIKQATVNLIMNTASIEYDDKTLKIEDLNRFVEKAGFKSLGISDVFRKQKKDIREKNNLILISILSIINLYISMAHMIKMPIIKYLNMSIYPINYSICSCILTSIILFLGRKIILSGIKNLIHLTPNMDTLVSIGVLSSYIYSIYGTIQILNGNNYYVENLYFESASTVLFFIKVGKFIENRNKNKTKEALQKLMTITPQNAVIERNGQELTVTIDEINKGDTVICRPGQKIAVDGIVIDGKTHIDESFITGESVPVKKEIESSVVAGSINYEGTIKYKAEKIGKESTVSEIVRLVAESTNAKIPIAKIADTVSSYFVPVIMCLAFIMFIVWLLISKDFSTSMNIFVSILVVACPCSLGLATPLAIVIATGLCSQKGILVKTGDSLEYACKVKTIVFDKTGTLTNGTLSINKVLNYSTIKDIDIVRILASIENKSEHPIAKSIVKYAKDNNLELLDVNDFRAIPGYGVFAKIDGNEYYVGNKNLMIDNNINVNSVDEEELTKSGNSIVFLSRNNSLMALIGIKDVIRNNIKEFISKLNIKNIDVVMLTGDNENTAKYIADEVGIKKIIANVSPKEKAEEIKKLKSNGKVLMCGDGINDSISLANSDIGVSISNGTDIAKNTANVVLMDNNICKIYDFINISEKTIKNIKQNLFWAFFYNICMIPIACGTLKKYGIILNPMIASLAMMLSSLTVVFNALRLKNNKE